MMFDISPEMVEDCIAHGLRGDHRTKVGAFILDGKHLISRGHNSMKTSPIQYKFARRAGRPEKICLHAEISAIINARQDVNGFRILVLRTTADGHLAMSRP